MRLAIAAGVLLVLLDVLPIGAQTTTPESLRAKAVTFEFGVKIPMPDGSTLNANVYRPRSGERVPALFYMTPYIADLAHPRGMYFARNGYVFVAVDTRGRGNSTGKLEPFVHEAAEGEAITAWLAKQPWTDGQVAMWGGSYGGFSQWAAASRKPAALRTIVPVASAHPGVDFPFLGNIFRSYTIQWQTYTSGAAAQQNLFYDGEFWTEKYLTRYLEHLRFASMDSLVGNNTTLYQEWLAHPTPDGYWARMNPTNEQMAAIDLPILSITGYFDGDQAGAMDYYHTHLRHASPSARAKHYLILGPWDHPGTRTPVKSIGGLSFGDASVLDMNQLQKEWYDWVMKGGVKPKFLEKRVAYWVMGAEQWKYADSLAAISDSTLRLLLDSRGGQANDVYASGQLSPKPATGTEPDSYRYDPLDTRPAANQISPRADYYLDQREAQDLHGQGVVYHTAPFTQATEITGVPKLTVWLSMDVPDTDIEMTVDEVRADGSTIRLSNEMMRMRWRESLTSPKPMPIGVPTRVTFEKGMLFSREIAAGSRIRLIVKALNSIAWQKNYNSGGDVSQETARDARTATVKVYHDPSRPSTLELPVVSRRLVP